jgi:hypothetical protein
MHPSDAPRDSCDKQQSSSHGPDQSSRNSSGGLGFKGFYRRDGDGQPRILVCRDRIENLGQLASVGEAVGGILREAPHDNGVDAGAE